MSDSNQPVDVIDDLDAFSEDFFNVKPKADVEDVQEEADDVALSAEDTDSNESTEDDALENDEAEDHEDEEDREPPKPKGRKPARERISELTAKNREYERRMAELERMIAEQQQKPDTKDVKADTPPANDGPNPDELLEDGKTLKYPLGEFDPNFIRDLTRHTLNAEREAMRKADEEEKARKAEQETVEKAEKELLTHWQERLEESLERLPDLREKAENLEETFTDLHPDYAKFLASTIMSLEYGPDVLNYLADNVDEAERIVAAGPTQAAIRLAKIEAKFESGKVEKGKVTNAPEPPPVRNKGSGARVSIPDDTDDLEAFEKKFFDKRKPR